MANEPKSTRRLPPAIADWLDCGRDLVFTGRELHRVSCLIFYKEKVRMATVLHQLPDKFLFTLKASLSHLDHHVRQLDRQCQEAVANNHTAVLDVKQWVVVSRHRTQQPSDESRAFSRGNSLPSESSLTRTPNMAWNTSRDFPALFSRLIRECRVALDLCKTLASLIYLEVDTIVTGLDTHVLRTLWATLHSVVVELRIVGRRVADLLGQTFTTATPMGQFQEKSSNAPPMSSVPPKHGLTWSPGISTFSPDTAPQKSSLAPKSSQRSLLTLCSQCYPVLAHITPSQYTFLTRCCQLSNRVDTLTTELFRRLKWLQQVSSPLESSSPTPTGRQTPSVHQRSASAVQVSTPTTSRHRSPPDVTAAAVPSLTMVSHFRRFSHQHPLGSLGADRFHRRIFHSKTHSDGSFGTISEDTGSDPRVSRARRVRQGEVSAESSPEPTGRGQVKWFAAQTKQPNPYHLVSTKNEELVASNEILRHCLGTVAHLEDHHHPTILSRPQHAVHAAQTQSPDRSPEYSLGSALSQVSGKDGTGSGSLAKLWPVVLPCVTHLLQTIAALAATLRTTSLPNTNGRTSEQEVEQTGGKGDSWPLLSADLRSDLQAVLLATQELARLLKELRWT
ncbi:hypothetical protein IWQ62_000528 [Dispira parvispora]|uniref:Uncharacterized protein n=1 Tax=Dispira parvispora TaxID=1520584 RepID=A0A9W8AUL6_9FUNG|nr:hypothetical protein IWQ62_000528 [Dispira parvispora]